MTRESQAEIKSILLEKGEELYRQARALVNQGDFAESQKYFEKALIVFKELEKSAWVARTYGRLAWMGVPRNDFEQIDTKLKEAEKYDVYQAVANYLWTAYLFLKKQDVEHARSYFQYALGIFDKLGLIEARQLESADFATFYDHFNQMSLKFYEELLKKETAEGWTDWALSDKARYYVVLAELEPMLQKRKEYFLKAEEWYRKAEIDSYAHFYKAKYYLLVASETVDVDTSLEQISNATKELERVKLKLDPQKDVAIVMLRMCHIYTNIIEARRLFDHKSKTLIQESRRQLLELKDTVAILGERESVDALQNACDALEISLASRDERYFEEKILEARYLLERALNNLTSPDFIGLKQLIRLELERIKILSAEPRRYLARLTLPSERAKPKRKNIIVRFVETIKNIPSPFEERR